jgi:hypothetical protein
LHSIGYWSAQLFYAHWLLVRLNLQGRTIVRGLLFSENKLRPNRDRWVTEKTLIATNKAEYDHALDRTIKGDWESLNQSINEGKLRYVTKGEQVQLTDPHTCALSQIRFTGDIKPWIIAKEFLSEKPIASLDEELKASRGNPTKANVNQKPLKGALSQIKILLGKPLDDWGEGLRFSLRERDRQRTRQKLAGWTLLDYRRFYG